MDFLPNRARPLRLALIPPTFPRNVNMWARPTNSTLASYPPNRNSRARQVGRSIMDRIKRRSTVQKVLRATKIALRRNGRTALALSNKQRVGRQIPISGGESKSFFTLKRPNKTKIGKLEYLKSTVVNNSAVRTTSLIGKQTSMNLVTCFDTADVSSLFTAIGITGKTARLILHSIHAESLITNCENSNARIYLYDIIARRDVQTGYVDPTSVFQAGFADASTGGSAANYLVPGVTPFGNHRFTEWFKILQTTEIILSPGATHTHVVHYAPNRLQSHEIDSATSAGCIAGLTVYTMLVVHGTPMNDSVTKTDVTLGPMNLDIVRKEMMSYSYAHQNYASDTITNSLNLTFAVGGETINDDGVVQADTNS